MESSIYFQYTLKLVSGTVLILVLMESSIYKCCGMGILNGYHVLILVLMESRIYSFSIGWQKKLKSLNPCSNGISYIQSMNQSIISRSSFVCIVEPLDCQHCVTFSQEFSQMYVDFVFKCWSLAIAEIHNGLFFSRLSLFKIFAND